MVRLLPRPPLLVLLALAAGAGISLPAAAAEPWLPLDAKRSFVHRLHRDVTFDPSNGPATRMFFRGRVEEEVGSAAIAGFPSESRPVRRAVIEKPISGDGQPTTERSRLHFTSRGGSLELHGVDSQEDAEAVTRYAPPLVLVPASPQPGQRWEVGALRHGSLLAKATAEVEGFEDVRVEDVDYAGCLKLRYAGPISATEPIALPGGKGRVTTGRYLRQLWLQRGVGIVQDVTEYQLDLEYLSGERTASITTVVTLRLQSSSAPLADAR